MRTPFRVALFVVTHALAVGVGVMAVVKVSAPSLVMQAMGTPTKALGGALVSLGDTPSEGAAAHCQHLVRAATPALGARTADVLTLHLRSLRAHASHSPADVTAAAELCHGLAWPACDSATIFEMGGSP